MQFIIGALRDPRCNVNIGTGALRGQVLARTSPVHSIADKTENLSESKVRHPKGGKQEGH